eukprot:c9001_g1_i1.p1 GENE.c9001_g1_i1~~c9001_g1_i1.p1  ORF type:complete len:577 (-),score=150.29 c9001_g1_i1:19-1749(-)
MGKDFEKQANAQGFQFRVSPQTEEFLTDNFVIPMGRGRFRSMNELSSVDWLMPLTHRSLVSSEALSDSHRNSNVSVPDTIRRELQQAQTENGAVDIRGEEPVGILEPLSPSELSRRNEQQQFGDRLNIQAASPRQLQKKLLSSISSVSDEESLLSLTSPPESPVVSAKAKAQIPSPIPFERPVSMKLQLPAGNNVQSNGKLEDEITPEMCERIDYGTEAMELANFLKTQGDLRAVSFKTIEDRRRASKRISSVMGSTIRPATQISDLYEIHEVLGSGAFGTVYRAVDKQYRNVYAIKVIPADVYNKNITLFELELTVLSKVRHPLVVKMRELVSTPKEMCLVLEYVPGGELFDQIVRLSHFSESVACDIMWQLSLGLEMLHNNGFVHRDLKPENILVFDVDENEQISIKLADLGLACCSGDLNAAHQRFFTPEYAAPEVVRGVYVSTSSDVWSLGVILYVMLCGFPPFYADSSEQVCMQVLAGHIAFPSPYWDNVSESAKDLIRRMMQIDFEARPSVTAIREHPWMTANAPGAEMAKDAAMPNTQKRLAQFNAARRFRSAIFAVMAANRITHKPTV